MDAQTTTNGTVIDTDDVQARPGTGTLGKAMSVVDIVASAPHPPRFTDILRACDQPRGTLHRQLHNLVEEGILNQRGDASYELGYRLLKFASKAWAGNEFRNISEPHLQRLHSLTGETVHLGVLRGNQVIYIDKVEGTQSVRMFSQIGNAGPVYCTGVGKAAMSALDDEALEDCIASITFHRYTDNTITTADALHQAVEDIRRIGIAFDREEHEAGIRCVAAPVYSQSRSVIAGVSVTGPAYRVSVEQLENWMSLVRETAGAIMDDMKTRLGPRG